MKKVLMTVSSFIVLFIGIYIFIKMNPALVAHSSAFSTDRHVQLVDVGNKSLLGDIQIESVLVNNDTSPENVNIQVSDHMKGFILSDSPNGEEASEYTFKDLDSITLKPKTDPQKQLDRANAGTATADDLIYALSVGHDEPVDQVIIKYRHLGIPHEMIVSTHAWE